MAKLPAPTALEYKVLPPDEYYEAIVTSIEQVENPFYDPANDGPAKAMQLKWTFRLRDAGNEDVTVSGWTSQTLSTHPKAILPKWVMACDPGFKMSDGLDTDDLVGKTCRLLIENVSKEKDGETKVYNKIVKLAESKLPALDDAAREAIVTKAAVDALGGEEIPFSEAQ